MLSLRQIGTKLICRNLPISTACYSSDSTDVVEVKKSIPAIEKWKKREQFTRSTIQRFEEGSTKTYYAPDWELVQYENDKPLSPTKRHITTPEKWNYYNKV